MIITEEAIVGTEISLEICGLTIYWSKNHIGVDHGSLFQDGDRKRRHSDQIDYDYFSKCDEKPERMEMAFAKPLKEITSRLELLGFTLKTAEADYHNVAQLCLEERQNLTDDNSEQPTLMSFEEFCTFATEHPVQSLDVTFINSTDGINENRVRGRFSDTNMSQRIPGSLIDEWSAYSERSYFGSLIGILHPYNLLHVLAGNSTNLESDVVWQYGPLVESGWANESQFIPNARRNQSVLIATEGSSDAHVLEHAFLLLRPEIADFFKFIDVSERHPFPGTGNLLKFAEGLAKIDVHNQVIFLFDNDAEGFDAYQRLLNFMLPLNMRTVILPELDEFRSFPAQGPQGNHNADINRRAAAIECYLDLELNGRAPAKVVWTNYKKNLGIYQGALESKEAYTKAFLKLTPKKLASSSYDVSKVKTVLNNIIAEATAIAVNVAMSSGGDAV